MKLRPSLVPLRHVEPDPPREPRARDARVNGASLRGAPADAPLAARGARVAGGDARARGAILVAPTSYAFVALEGVRLDACDAAAAPRPRTNGVPDEPDAAYPPGHAAASGGRAGPQPWLR